MTIYFSDTTHLICARSGTAKYKQAKKQKLKIVNPAWLWVTYHYWARQPEEHFILPESPDQKDDEEGKKMQKSKVDIEYIIYICNI